MWPVKCSSMVRPGSRPSGSSKRLFKSAYVGEPFRYASKTNTRIINFGDAHRLHIKLSVGYPFRRRMTLHIRYSGHPGMIHTGHAAVIHGREDVPLSGRSAPSIDIISPLLSMPPIWLWVSVV
jgi:hypothetical protein